jgi:S-adenosylmethionine synthetase
MRPYFIEQRLKLRNPIYSETAAYIWVDTETVTKTFSAQVGIRKRLRLNYLHGKN